METQQQYSHTALKALTTTHTHTHTHTHSHWGQYRVNVIQIWLFCTKFMVRYEELIGWTLMLAG